MENSHFLTDADVRKLRDMARRVGGGNGSQRPVPKRRRHPFGATSSSPASIALCYKNIGPAAFAPPTETEPAAITPSAVIEQAVRIFDFEKLAVDDRTAQDKLLGSETFYDAINVCFEKQVIADDGGPNKRGPVRVEGFLREYAELESPGGNLLRETVFVITDILYPVSIIKGRTTTAVAAGQSFAITDIELRWGRHPGLTTVSVQNPAPNWSSPPNGYCLAMQQHNGTWIAIDLECVP
jgi:hypothetical protein